MVTLFNNQLTADQVTTAVNDRALQFGDGLFETIKVAGSKVQLLDYHRKRLTLGAAAMGINLPDYLSVEQLEPDIIKLMELNHLENNANVKLMLWRRNEKQRAYASDDNHSNTLLLIRKSKGLTAKNKCGFSDDIRLHYWKLSRFKTTSALPYVMASRERDQRNLDELILLNVHDHLTECTASNLYWIKDDEIFTPSLQTGCIAGVMRAFLLDQHDIKINEVEAKKEHIMEADAAFTSNSQGIQPINSIDDTSFKGSALMDDVVEISRKMG